MSTKMLKTAAALASVKLLVAARHQQREDVFTNIICNAGREIIAALLPMALMGQLSTKQLVSLTFLNEYFSSEGDPARMERHLVEAMGPLVGSELHDICREAEIMRDRTIQEWPPRQEST